MVMDILSQLMRDEGVRLAPYHDHLGYLTIGVGRLIDPARGGGITQEEALYLLRNDVASRERRLAEAYPWFQGLSEARRGALVNMAFQLGASGLARFPRMLACLRDERWAEAETHALDSEWARQTPARAKRVARQLATGEWQ
jgi:lysozyme